MNRYELENKLRSIFEHYKNYAGFEDEIVFTESFNFLATADHVNKRLIYNITALDYYFNDEQNKIDFEDRMRLSRSNKDIFFIAVLLHEIGHIIDKQQNEYRLKKEFSEMIYFLYTSDRGYHHNRPFEIRADGFARRELSKWYDIQETDLTI